MALASQLLRLPPELKAQAESQAATAGLTTSEWIRRALASAASPAHGAVLDRPPVPERQGDGERRVSIRAPREDVARWEAEALLHGLNLTRYVRLQMSVTPEQGQRVATAVEALRHASVELARVGRNLNQISRNLNAFPGQSTPAQRESLAKACSDVGAFCDDVTAVCGALHLQLGRRRRVRPSRTQR